jgi:hypothetical protein
MINDSFLKKVHYKFVQISCGIIIKMVFNCRLGLLILVKWIYLKEKAPGKNGQWL